MLTLGEGSGDTNPKWYVIQGDITINDRITVTGNVHLILADNAKLQAKQGIDVSAGNSLTIYAQTDMLTENTGKIVATISDYNAGIGGSKNKDGGSIKITGGTVTANSNDSGAGIGGGSYAAGGNIEITGGDVIATSRSGAGIGGGEGGDGGTIKITGGKVIAGSDPDGGAGIGAGKDGAAGSFSTGPDGKALIEADSISDTSDEGNWKGIIFQEDRGKVYGEQELSYDFDVGGGYTLEIPSGGKLTIPQGKTLGLNHGTKLENNGTLENNGKIKKRKGSEIRGNDTTGSGKLIDTPHSTPTAVIDYRAEKLTNLDSAISYLITFDGNREDIDKPADGKIDIKEQWLSKTLSIMAKEDDSFLESEKQSLPIPARPVMPAVNGADEANYGKNNGKITSTTDKMEYTPSSSNDWKPCTAGETKNLAPGKYLVRIAPTENGFASEAAEVAIKKIHLITVENIGGGTAEANKKEAYKDTEITLTAASKNGHYFKKWQIVPSVTITDNKFTMPDGNVTVKAVFEEKAIPALTVKLDDWTYGETANTPTVTGNTGDGAVTYEYFTDEGLTVKTTNVNSGADTEGSVPKNAGRYYLKTTIAETATYKQGSVTTAFEIKKANQATFSINPVGEKKYANPDFNLTTTGGSGTGGVTYSVPANNGVLSINGSTAKIIGVGEVTVTAVKAGNRNYNEISAELKITIAKAFAPVITFPTAGDLTYGQKLSESTLTGGSTEYGTFAWKNKNIIPTVTNTGYEVVFTPSEKTLKNYEEITDKNGSVLITVAKGKPAINLTANISGDSGNRTVMLAVEVTGAKDAAKPSGNVKFSYKDGGTFAELGTAELADGKASYKWENVEDKIYEIKAEYAGDGNYNSVTSAVKQIDTRKQSQSDISFTAVSDKTYGDGEFTLSITGGSGEGEVTYSVPNNNGVLKIKADKATIIGAGSVIITAKKAADENYNAASKSISITVLKKKLKVKAEDKTVVKGERMPTFTYNKAEVDKSLAKEDTFKNPLLQASADNTKHTGEYDITVSGGTFKNKDGTDVKNNYMVTYENGKLNIVDALYEVRVIDGTGSGKYSKGQTVNITANDKSGYTFIGWTSLDGVVFANASSKTTSFIMPAKAVTVKADYRADGGGSGGGGSSSGGSGGSSGGSSSDGSSGGGTHKDDGGTNTEKNTNLPTTAKITVKAKKGKDKTATAEISDKTVENAINKAKKEAKKNGKKVNAVALEINMTMPKGTDKLNLNITEAALRKIAADEIKTLTINTPVLKTEFDKKAVLEIKKQSKGNISVNIIHSKKLSKEAKKLIGKRPVYDMVLSYGGTKENIKALKKGKIKLNIFYSPVKNEKLNGLYVVYVNKKGRLRKVKGSVYDKKSSCMIFNTKNFGTFGIGYTAN